VAVIDDIPAISGSGEGDNEVRRTTAITKDGSAMVSSSWNGGVSRMEGFGWR
jgi:hypothetical protein